MDTYELLELVFGYFSIACWLIVFSPQLWTNYRRKSGESLSLPFLIIWLVGDVFSVAGLLLLELELYQIVLAVYYSVVDAALIGQVYHYRAYRRRKQETRRIFGQDLIDNDSDYDCDDDDESVQVDSKHSTEIVKQYWDGGKSTMPLFLVACMLQQYSALSSIQSIGDNDDDNTSTEESMSSQKICGYVCAYFSAVLYIGSRIPQLVKNFNAKSTEGLSIWLFLFSVLGNAAYCAAIATALLGFYSDERLLKNIPYILGSGGTLVFDFSIFIQFFVYRKSSYHAVEDEEEQVVDQSTWIK